MNSITTDTPEADLQRQRIADLETMQSLLEERLCSEQRERRRVEQLYEACCADRERLQRVVVTAEVEGD